MQECQRLMDPSGIFGLRAEGSRGRMLFRLWVAVSASRKAPLAGFRDALDGNSVGRFHGDRVPTLPCVVAMGFLVPDEGRSKLG